MGLSGKDGYLFCLRCRKHFFSQKFKDGKGIPAKCSKKNCRTRYWNKPLERKKKLPSIAVVIERNEIQNSVFFTAFENKNGVLKKTKIKERHIRTVKSVEQIEISQTGKIKGKKIGEGE